MIRGRLLVGVMAACLCLVATAQDGTYYKWTDASGTVHFSATPPPGSKARALRLDGQAGAQAAPTPPPPAAQPGDELERAQMAYRKQACEAARGDVRVLDQKRMVVTGKSPDAATKLDSEQRAQARLRATQRVAQFCKVEAKP